ncbi:hypothetical protein M8R20_25110 [Pseudomonas sp. R2.Fl]|nr:hypothetical protein [Pseudomonas sp. R2.Fl]
MQAMGGFISGDELERIPLGTMRYTSVAGALKAKRNRYGTSSLKAADRESMD